MVDLWNEICAKLNQYIKNDVLEKEYENAFVDCLSLLGWRRSKGEICTQDASQVGHGKVIADIVIKEKDLDLFVIEIKRPSHTISDADERQLFSYMQLRKMSFGIYVGQSIHLYYNNLNTQSQPYHILEIDITENNTDGVKFVELFSKDTFNIDTIKRFCEQQIQKCAEQEQIQKEITHLLNDGPNILKEALRQKYTAEGHPAEWIDKLLSQIRLEVLPIHTDVELPNEPNPLYKYNTAESLHLPKSKTKTLDYYSINGEGRYGVGPTALYIVRHIVKKNPHLSFFEIQKILGSYARIIKPLEEIEQYQKTGRDSNYANRWNDEALKSKDGIVFAVSTQWTKYNIICLIEIGRKFGLDIHKI